MKIYSENNSRSVKNTRIIAEAGVNHNGNMNTAKKMIEIASECGADYIKFQSFKTENLVKKNAPLAEYQKSNITSNISQFDLIKKYELSPEDHLQLFDYCKEKNILFLSSPFDLESIDLLSDLGIKIWKIPSGEITNLPYLRKIGSLKNEVIISSGMSTLGEIETAVNILIQEGTDKQKITVLHCNSEYPTPPEDVNLKAMLTIKNALKINTGFSDHTLGIEIPIAAAALGASVIEKHFTLDKNMDGPDHKASIEPDELKEMIKAIRNIDLALGNGVKIPQPSELKNRDIVRKSIVALKDIKKGELFSEKNITIKRPGNGLSPMFWDSLLNTISNYNFKKDDFIKF